MHWRFSALRFALAVLAVFGQLTPLLALPMHSLLQTPPQNSLSNTISNCACKPIEKLSRGCCCSKPDDRPKRGSCCDTLAQPKQTPKSCCAKPEPTQVPSDEQLVTTVPGTPTLTPGGKCCCDKPVTAANAEPSCPPNAEIALGGCGDSVAVVAIPAPLAVCVPHIPPAPPPKVSPFVAVRVNNA